jgi:uncharacterized protein (TIGR02588 family)
MALRDRKQEHQQRRSATRKPSPESSRFNPSDREAEGIPTLEWVIGGIGFLIVAGVLGFFLYAAISDQQPLPDVKFSVDEVVQVRSGYLVRITASNEGGLTAEGVIVEGELRRGAESIEQSRTVIEYLPSRSKKRIGLFFSQDPERFELKIRSHGYEEP